MRRQANRLKEKPQSQRHSQTVRHLNQIGPGERHAVVAANRELRRLFKKSPGKAQLEVKFLNARNEAWMEKLKKRNSWRASQGMRLIAPEPQPQKDALPDENNDMTAWAEGTLNK